jgi:hypothetical protein
MYAGMIVAMILYALLGLIILYCIIYLVCDKLLQYLNTPLPSPRHPPPSSVTTHRSGTATMHECPISANSHSHTTTLALATTRCQHPYRLHYRCRVPYLRILGWAGYASRSCLGGVFKLRLGLDGGISRARARRHCRGIRREVSRLIVGGRIV